MANINQGLSLKDSLIPQGELTWYNAEGILPTEENVGDVNYTPIGSVWKQLPPLAGGGNTKLLDEDEGDAEELFNVGQRLGSPDSNVLLTQTYAGYNDDMRALEGLLSTAVAGVRLRRGGMSIVQNAVFCKRFFRIEGVSGMAIMNIAGRALAKLEHQELERGVSMKVDVEWRFQLDTESWSEPAKTAEGLLLPAGVVAPPAPEPEH